MNAIERGFRALAGLARLLVQRAQLRLQAFGHAGVDGRLPMLADLVRRHDGCARRRRGHGMAQALDGAARGLLEAHGHFPYAGAGGEDLLRCARNTVRIRSGLLQPPRPAIRKAR